MSGTTGLTPTTGEGNSMEENWLWYLSGSMDSILRMVVNIRKSQNSKLGYQITPEMTFARPDEVESVFGMVDEYVEDVGSGYSIEESSSSKRMVIRGEEDARKFLEPIVGGFVQQRDRADFYLNEILPMFEDGSPDTKSEFLEIVEKVEELREYPITSYESKYDAEYFRRRWGANPSE